MWQDRRYSFVHVSCNLKASKLQSLLNLLYQTSWYQTKVTSSCITNRKYQGINKLFTKNVLKNSRVSIFRCRNWTFFAQNHRKSYLLFIQKFQTKCWLFKQIIFFASTSITEVLITYWRSFCYILNAIKFLVFILKAI